MVKTWQKSPKNQMWISPLEITIKTSLVSCVSGIRSKPYPGSEMTGDQTIHCEAAVPSSWDW